MFRVTHVNDESAPCVVTVDVADDVAEVVADVVAVLLADVVADVVADDDCEVVAEELAVVVADDVADDVAEVVAVVLAEDVADVVTEVVADVVAVLLADVVKEVVADDDCEVVSVEDCVVWSHALKLPAKCESIASFIALTVVLQSFNPAVIYPSIVQATVESSSSKWSPNLAIPAILLSADATCLHGSPSPPSYT